VKKSHKINSFRKKVTCIHVLGFEEVKERENKERGGRVLALEF